MECAYCEKVNKKENYQKVTREHVIPDFILEDTDLPINNYFWDRGKIIKSDIFVKDVCNICNNGKLASLDGFVSGKIWPRLKRDIFINQIMFYYFDYLIFSRWLLKILYNHARSVSINNIDNIYNKDIIDYILGYSEYLAGLKIYSNIIPLERGVRYIVNLEESDGRGITNVYFRIGYLHYYPVDLDISISMMISFNCHYFYIVVSKEDLSIYFPKKYYTELLKYSTKCILKKSNQSLTESLKPTLDKYKYRGCSR